MGYADELAAWARGRWRELHGEVEPNYSRIAKDSGKSWPTVRDFFEGNGQPDQETVDLIARALGVTKAPRIYKAVDLGGSVQEPRTAVEWIDEAQAALNRAKGALPRGATESPATTVGVRAVHEASKKPTSEKTPRPAGARKRKAG